MKLKDKVAIVTGGAQGLGEGIVNCLAKEGAHIAIIDINGKNARKVAGEVQSLGRKALAIEADVTDNNKVVKAVQETLDFFGKLDILVNNAGGYPSGYLEADPGMRIVDRTEEEWDGNYKLNLKTAILMCQAVIPHMVKQKSGKIINIASVGAQLPANLLVCYTTTKAGVVYYTKALARDLAPDNINVNCVLPGVIYTPLWERLATVYIKQRPKAKEMTPHEYFVNSVVPRVPMGREQTPEDIGHAVVFFASDEAKNITGQDLAVDGGMAFV